MRRPQTALLTCAACALSLRLGHFFQPQVAATSLGARRGWHASSSSRAAISEEHAAHAQAQGSESAKTERAKRVLSGVQPTGNLHLGNYLGAIKQWVASQDEGYENFFCAVDMHAITMPHDPKVLKDATFQTVATYLAAGVDPKKSKIFVQSHVTAHAELTWLLSCATPMGWLERMIQYKEKAVKQGENVSVGLFTYPVLMAADILLYQADLVPVGEDQRQHLELARDIARRFNDKYCKKRRRTFKEPQAMIIKEGARVMSLQDGTSKMSKSDPNENSRIALTDSSDLIVRKIKKCKSDAIPGLEWDNPERPECTNLLTIYQAVTGLTKEQVAAEVADLRWGDFKPRLADAVVAHLEPIQSRYHDLMEDKSYLYEVMRDGADAADEVASQSLLWTKQAMGFSTREDLIL
jgi:tryptophanyl-tRNA synthetase